MATGSENYLSLVKQAASGELKLPAFQRPFKWNRKQVVLLYDSIRQSYPLGSVIFLSGGKQELKERAFRGAHQDAANKETKSLVLDRQQRLTAGIDLFFGNSPESNSQYFIDLSKLEAAAQAFGLDLENDAQVDAFLQDLDTDSGYCVARASVADPFSLLNKSGLLWTVLLRPDNSKHRDHYLEIYEDAHPEKKSLIRNLVKPHLVVNAAPDLPYVSIDSALQLDAISRIFATLNSSGTVLTPFELVVAVLFKGGIDLRDDISVLKELYPLYRNMDQSGEIVLQTVVMLNGGNQKKSLLPRNLSAEAWEKDKDRAGKLLNEVGEFLTTHLGMALDKTSKLVPYDSIFAPLAVVFDQTGYAALKPSQLGPYQRKIKKWVVGSALSSRYQEGVHTKQIGDANALVEWIQQGDDAYEPSWLKEVRIPRLLSVTPNGAISNLLRCIMNRELLIDPLVNAEVNFGLPGLQAHHVFPKKFVEKIVGWDSAKGDKHDLALNLMQLTSATNARFLNDDPRLQVIDAKKSNAIGQVEANYARQGISKDALAILEKPEKTKEDYWNFIKLRETFFEGKLEELGFHEISGETVEDDLEDA